MSEDLNYAEGDWFAVTLKDVGYAVGVVARSDGTGLNLGYFFGPRYHEVPTTADVAALDPSDAILVGRFGDLQLIRGEWPIIGRAANWDRTQWPMPVFFRQPPLTGVDFLVYYDDDDPSERIRIERVDGGVPAGAQPDRMMGAGSVERHLTSSLGPPPASE